MSTFSTRLARRSHFYKPSPIRAVFNLELGEDCISLAGGNPDLGFLPLEELATRAQESVLEKGKIAFQYGATKGYDPFIEQMIELMNLEGISASSEEFLVTSGSQMGLDLISKLFINPGDVVLTTSPTYPGAINTFQGMEAKVIQLRSDEQGICPVALREEIERCRRNGDAVKFLYLIPTFANPTGVTMSNSRRRVIAQLCREAEIVIVEDNPYGLISFTDHRPESFKEIDPENVIYLGSLSKIFSPGLRLGWVAAPVELRVLLEAAAENAAICPSVYSQVLATSYFLHSDWASNLEVAVGHYRRRMEALFEGLDTFMPEGVSWIHPEGGFFTWLTLPEGCDSEVMLQSAINDGVLFIPGTAFYAGSEGRNELRLAFSQVPEKRLIQGARRLGKVVEKQLINCL
ncbi:PLP-dependent aminotransferase family protein [Corynebacterium sp. SCR221107]|uniref:aminotransferase-like domain-containing protein n=1 Tax=Corynebacterium TaxID=1716 RepID=UPI00068BE6EC|nr:MULTISPECIES: PLP-dependent aminotransferase family protein [Corynebacterium]WBT08717.1 PLP-dependent aminotransferase family protein [Corynebacterium sp. SCR221107]